MAHPTPFRFPVADLLREPGRRRSVAIDTAVDWALEISRVGPRLQVELTLEGVSSGVLARGQIETEATHTCHRCLTEWTEPVGVELAEVIGLADDPDGYPLEADFADLEGPIRDAVLLAMPLAPTCRPDCMGLCATCGGDLNTGACPGHDEEIDSPFASLRELLEP